MSQSSPMPHRSWLLTIGVIGALGAPIEAQVVTGRVVQMGWGEPVSGALVMLLDGTLAQVDSALTDGSGRFVFSGVRPGSYQFQAAAGGEFSTLSEAVGVGRSDAPEVLLLMPSVLFARASDCLPQAVATGAGVLVGVAYEATTRSPIPSARVRVQWGALENEVLETTADAGGRFHFCSLPGDTPLSVRMSAFGREADAADVTIEGGTMHRSDLGLTASTGPLLSAELLVLERNASGRDHSRVTGVVVDATTGQPVPAALVSLAGAKEDVLTDGAGRFRIEDVTAADQLMEIERLGYGKQSATVAVGDRSEVVVEVRLPARPVELTGVAVDARRPMLGLIGMNSSRVVSGAAMAAYENRGATFENILRERFPIRISKGVFSINDINQRITCLESRRRTSFSDRGSQTDTILSFPECNMIPMFVDDVPVADPGTFVDHVHVEDFETILYLPPTEVGVRYGLEGNSVGVILLYTRGRGPFVDRARNVR